MYSNRERKEVEAAYDDMDFLVDSALEQNDKGAQKYLRELWDNESWDSIKEKLQTEGSAWHVWYMDGVHALIANRYNWKDEMGIEAKVNRLLRTMRIWNKVITISLIVNLSIVILIILTR